MAELDILIKSKVRHVGFFDFKETYRILYEWLVDQGYDVNEKSYKEVIAAGNAKDIELEWEALRKVSDYLRFHLKIGWKIFGMTSVEVEVDGVKKKVNKGDVAIESKCTLIKDYEDRWSKNAFFAFLRGMYDRYIIPARIDQFEGKLIGEQDEFLAQAKAFMNLTGSR